MNAKPIFDQDNYVMVNFNGYEYPFKYTKAVMKKFAKRYGDEMDLEGMETLDRVDELVWQLCAMFDGARKTADYFGLDPLPEVTEKELDELFDISELAQLYKAVPEAIRKMKDKMPGADQPESEKWTAEEIGELGDAPKPDDEELKN